MRTQKRRGHPGGRPLQKLTSAIDQDRALAADISDRILVDKFGLTHDRAILRLWPDKLRVLLDVRFVDRREARP